MLNEFIDKIGVASIGDLQFESQPLQEHRESLTERIGFRLVAVGDAVLPGSVRLSYVVSQSASGESIYVVIWPAGDSAEPYVRDVGSVVEAQALLLDELRARFARLPS